MLDRILDRTVPGGVALVGGLAVGELGDTPSDPMAPTHKDSVSEQSLLAASAYLGEPVGYLPEHGGEIVQNLVPTQADAGKQTSTSSAVRLGWHTETAFHPYLPRFLVLLCLKGDPTAHTTYSSIDDIIGSLDGDTIDVLTQPRFRTGVDLSFTHGLPGRPSEPHAVIDRRDGTWIMRWDELLTFGLDDRAAEALRVFGEQVDRAAKSVVLAAGELLVVDNERAVHGRSPFRPRFDGSDRWLQRAFVVESLAPSTADRNGRVITTQFVLA